MRRGVASLLLFAVLFLIASPPRPAWTASKLRAQIDSGSQPSPGWCTSERPGLARLPKPPGPAELPPVPPRAKRFAASAPRRLALEAPDPAPTEWRPDLRELALRIRWRRAPPPSPDGAGA